MVCGSLIKRTRPGTTRSHDLRRADCFLKKTDSAPVALEDRCCHRQTKLFLGTIEGDDLRCRYHGPKFDAQGRLIEIPSQKKIPSDAGVKCYPTPEYQNYIHICIGDPDKALSAPHYTHHELSLEGWTSMQAQFNAECSWRLLVVILWILLTYLGPIKTPLGLQDLRRQTSRLPNVTIPITLGSPEYCETLILRQPISKQSALCLCAET